MLLLKALLLWALVAVHVVGAAFFFRRLFARESAWLAFIIPEIAVALVCNFVEYHAALTELNLMLPLTTAAATGGIIWQKRLWRVMRLPTLLFLLAFAGTFFLRVLLPNIENVRDGIPDLSVIADYLFGERLPVESAWLPPIKMEVYYSFGHYTASVLIRLLGIDIGTGFNICAALLNAYICFLAAAIAWHLSWGKLWITLLMLALAGCAGPGDTGCLWLTTNDLIPQNIIDPYSLIANHTAASNWFLRQLTPIYLYDQHLLMPPSYGVWGGCFHSTQAGELVICLSILSLIEVLRRRRTNWSWISMALSPFLMIVTCTWGLPMVLFLIAGGVVACRRMKLAPANLGMTVAVSVALPVLLEPMLLYFLQPVRFAGIDWNTRYHTQVPEFLVQWWPVYLPWLCLPFIWNRIHPVVRMVFFMAPLAFAGIEIWNFGARFDSTAKFWGLVFTAAMVTFVPEVARQSKSAFRFVLLLIVFNGALSLGFWSLYSYGAINWDEFSHLDGHGDLQTDRRKARILEVVSRLDNQVIIPGRSGWAGAQSALVSLLSHNKAYVVWSNFTDTILYTNGIMEAYRRESRVNMIYDGKDANPLKFLIQRDIAALVIYPDDQIDPTVVEQLKKDLAPYYTYEDANPRLPDQIANDTSPIRPCAGVFIYHPEIAAEFGLPKNADAIPFHSAPTSGGSPTDKEETGILKSPGNPPEAPPVPVR